jgi:pimeloyl-ACP methyl ester carboxylesterase
MKIFESLGFRIQYETWGNPVDHPVLFFHGFPGSHIQAKGLVPYLAEHKMFLIAYDRPGYGGSVGSGSRLQSINAVHNLLASLEIAKFDIIGVSGGAPWAHLMASRFSESVRSMRIICGLSTYNNETAKYFSRVQKRGLALSRRLPTWAAEKIVNFAFGRFDPEKRLDLILKFLDPTDQEIFRTPQNRNILIESMLQARSQGARGIVRDTRLYQRDWLREDCDLGRLSSIPTYYCHGMKDRILDHRITHWMHQANPNSKIKIFKEEGHYSLPFRQVDAILSEVY